MRIPSSALVALLPAGMSFEVRTADYQPFDRAMAYTDALARAIRGEVEAIATRSGKIKCLRLLPESERQPAPELVQAPAKESNASVVARTNLGVYRQAVEHISESDERTIIGYTYAFSLLRGAGL